MRNSYKLVLVICLTLSLARMVSGTILPTWNDERAYRPIPAGFVHGMNSSPEAWGFQIDQGTEEVLGYTIPGTAYGLFQYFDNYLDKNPVTNEPLSYLEPFNYQYNTFDSIKWNAYEGYVDESGNVHNGEQYPDGRINEEAARPTLRVYQEGGSISNVSGSPVTIGGIFKKYKDPLTDELPKVNLVAHSLGGVVSRYYINKTQGANVNQLTTLGTPHKGTLSATLADIIVINPVTDPFRWRIIWQVLFIRIFDDLDVNREPFMIYELKPSSQFIKDLNSSIPSISRYYCIGGTVRGFPPPFIDYTDGFIELHSALAEERSFLPPVLPTDSQLSSILPNYKGRILVPAILNPLGYLENKHTKLPNKWEEILKAIDNTKPMIELIDIKDMNNRVIWRVGQWPDYFEVPTDGRVKVHGLCREEYLPADTYINIGFRKAGRIEIQWIKGGGGLTLLQDEAQKWLLQPSDLWRASDLNSPVAEFEVEINFPLQEITHSIVVQATNPAGIKSDPVEVVEKTHYIYAVGKDNNGEGVLQCFDGPTSFADGVSAVVSEFSLVDEEGNKISARPLDITTDRSDVWAQNIWVSFDNKRIYCYDISTMKPKQLADGQYYYTATATPDGLYYDGTNLQYSSSSNNKIYRINLTNGLETDLGAVSRRLSLDGVVTDSIYVNYTTQEYTGYNPIGISANYICSLGKISKRDGNNSLIQTLPRDTPIWTNEQNTPAPCSGISEVTDYSVPEGHVIYLSCTDGNIYKVRFVDKISPYPMFANIGTVLKKEVISPYYPTEISYTLSGFFATLLLEAVEFENFLTFTYRAYGKVTPPPSFIEAKVVYKHAFYKRWDQWDGTKWNPFAVYPGPIASTTYRLCSYDESWTNEQKFNASTSIVLWAYPYSGTGVRNEEVDPAVSITDVTSIIPSTTFYYTGRYDNEGQDLGVSSPPIPWPIPIGYVRSAIIGNTLYRGSWTFLTDNGSLETLTQFSLPSIIAEGITTGPKVKIRIEPEVLRLNIGQSGELKVNGKGPYTWESSDDTVCVIEGDGEIVTVKAVGTGTSTISVRDALGNIAYAGVEVL